MRIQLIIGLLTFVSTLTATAAPSVGGGDSSAVAAPALAAGVVIKKVQVSPFEINPEMGKVARWDTSDISNMYHVDMLTFSDTLIYDLKDEAGNWKYVVPHKGIVTSGFGKRALFGRRFHKGLDIDLETGDPIHAALEGKVRIARYNRGYGNMVVISHEGGLETLYGHLSELDVEEGDIVKAGEVIGLGGSTGQSTGPHLHFEVRVMGEQVDPSWVIDTQTLMPRTSVVKIDKSWFEHLAEMREVEVHVVAAGETLEQIANMYELDKVTILQLNDLPETTTDLEEGMRLKLN